MNKTKKKYKGGGTIQPRTNRRKFRNGTIKTVKYIGKQTAKGVKYIGNQTKKIKNYFSRNKGVTVNKIKEYRELMKKNEKINEKKYYFLKKKILNFIEYYYKLSCTSGHKIFNDSFCKKIHNIKTKIESLFPNVEINNNKDNNKNIPKNLLFGDRQKLLFTDYENKKKESFEEIEKISKSIEEYPHDYNELKKHIKKLHEDITNSEKLFEKIGKEQLDDFNEKIHLLEDTIMKEEKIKLELEQDKRKKEAELRTKQSVKIKEFEKEAKKELQELQKEFEKEAKEKELKETKKKLEEAAKKELEELQKGFEEEKKEKLQHVQRELGEVREKYNAIIEKTALQEEVEPVVETAEEPVIETEKVIPVPAIVAAETETPKEAPVEQSVIEPAAEPVIESVEPGTALTGSVVELEAPASEQAGIVTPVIDAAAETTAEQAGIVTPPVTAIVAAAQVETPKEAPLEPEPKAAGTTTQLEVKSTIPEEENNEEKEENNEEENEENIKPPSLLNNIRETKSLSKLENSLLKDFSKIIIELSPEELDNINNLLTQTDIPFENFIRKAQEKDEENDENYPFKSLRKMEEKSNILGFVRNIENTPQHLSDSIIEIIGEIIHDLTDEQLEEIRKALNIKQEPYNEEEPDV